MEAWFHCNYCLTCADKKSINYMIRQCGVILCQYCSRKRKERNHPCTCGKRCTELPISSRNNFWFLESADTYLRRALKSFSYQELQAKHLLGGLNRKLAVAIAEAEKARRIAKESERTLKACECKEKEVRTRIEILREKFRTARGSMQKAGSVTSSSAISSSHPSRRSRSPKIAGIFDTRPVFRKSASHCSNSSYGDRSQWSSGSSGSSKWTIDPVTPLNSGSSYKRQYGVPQRDEIPSKVNQARSGPRPLFPRYKV